MITPKNWDSFQHYKNRSPAWIKLHRGLLDDFEFARLPVASRALAPMLWLLASEYEGGKITASIEELAFRLRMSENEMRSAITPLIDSGFFHASETLAACKQSACLEREEEEEEEEEIEKKEPEAKASAPIGAASVNGEVTEAFVYRLGQTVLGAGSGGQITKLRKMFRHDLDKIHSVLLQAQDKGSAREWIAGVLRGSEFAKPTMDEICPPDIYRNVL